MKISHKLRVRMDRTQFFYYAGLQPNMNAGMIKEHECIISDFHELFDQLKHVLNV